MNTQPKKKKSLFRRILKWTGITFLLLILAIIILPFVFKDKIIQIAKDEANKQLNAKVDFGQFDLTLFSSFPDFRFKIDNVSIVGINEFAGDTLIGIKHLETDVDLMSVIKGDQYKVKEILIEQPRIKAIVMHDGKANWDITKPSTDTTAAASGDTSATKFKLSLKKLEIKDAVITYDDAKSNMNAGIDDFDFSMSGDFTQDNFLMEITSEIQKLNFSSGGVAYTKNLHNKLKINMDMDMPNMKFTFKENEFTFNDLVLGIDGFVAMPGKDINTDVKFICNQTEFKSILSLIPAVYSKDFASVQTKGKLALNGYAKGTYNDKTMPAFGAHLEIADAMFKYPSLPKSVNNINVKVDVQNATGNPDATLIDVHKFHVEMAGNPVDMVMHIATPVSDPSLNGEVSGKIVLASVKEFIPLEKGDDMNGTVTLDVKMNGRMSMIEKQKYDEFKASGSVEVDKMNYKTTTLPFEVLLNTMKLNFTPQYVELAGFDAKMGRSDINASGKIENFMQYIFKDSLIKGVFAMNSSLIDINELMGPPAPAGAAAATPAPADSTPMSVIGVPKNIDFVLNSNIAKLIYDKIDITNVSGNIVVRNARVDMTNLKMNLLDGSMVMSGAYDTKNMKKPTIDFDLNINDVDISKAYGAFDAFAKMAPAGKYAKGKFTATVNDMVGTLNEKMEPDMNSLTGHGQFKTSAVSVEGFEPFVKLGDALKMDKFKKVEFSNISAPYEFKDGRVHLKDTVRTKISDINTKIIGSTGFDQTIDYKWKMEIPTKALPSQATGALNGLIAEANKNGGKFSSLGDKVDVTALFGGTVTKPVIKTGLKDMAKNAVEDVKSQVKEKIEEKKEEVINDVKQKASAEADKILADAQKEADNVKSEAAKLAEQVKTEGYKQADDLEANAGNPIAKLAAKKAAEKLRKESDAKAQKINDEAAVKSDKIMEEARGKADKLKQQ